LGAFGSRRREKTGEWLPHALRRHGGNGKHAKTAWGKWDAEIPLPMLELLEDGGGRGGIASSKGARGGLDDKRFGLRFAAD